MRTKILTLLAIVMISTALMTYDLWQKPAVAPSPGAITPLSQDAPDITFATLDGRIYHLRRLPEPGVILHFWASWCAPCALEFPALLKKIASAHGKLALVAVSIDDRRTNMEKFISRLPKAVTSHVYWTWDADKTMSLKNFDTIRAPESVLIDARRRMTEKIAGDPGWDSTVIAEKLKVLARP